MNRRTFHMLFCALCALLAIWTTASCSSDDDYDPSAGTATLQLNISTSDIMTRAPQEDYDEMPGSTNEYMHSLRVIIVDNATKKIVWTYTGEFANGANTRSFLSEPIGNVPVGRYDIYAFSNFSGHDAYSDFCSALDRLTVGGTLAANFFDAYAVLDDPAAKIDLDNGKYIPMSGKNIGFLVTEATNIIPVPLDRLVSKVNLTVNVPRNSEIKALTFTGWANKVTLFSDGTLPADVAYTETKQFTTIPATENGQAVIPSFYVNETKGSQRFGVSVTTTENGTPTYEASTSRTDLPRNCIYPLTLAFDRYTPVITWTAWASPIGAYPQTITPTWQDDNTFTVAIVEGAQFQLGVSINDRNNPDVNPTVTGLTLALKNPAADANCLAFETAANANPVKGHVAAVKDLTVELLLKIKFNAAGENELVRNYNVTIKTTDIADAAYIRPVRSASGWPQKLPAEFVRMVKR